MRPRFSLKWLLIAFTLLGVALDIAFVLLAVFVKRFVAAGESGNYSELAGITHNDRTMKTLLALTSTSRP